MRVTPILLAVLLVVIGADLWFTYTGATGSRGRGEEIIARLERMEKNQNAILSAYLKR